MREESPKYILDIHRNYGLWISKPETGKSDKEET